MNSQHEKYIHRALELAERGRNKVLPNPKVGCVIVYEDRIIAEGWHEFFGGFHAERNAIDQCFTPSFLPKSTLYVNLEPCCHTGKTPPCTDLIIQSGIKKVVIGCIDPFDKVKGKGIKQLKAHGVEVITGICERECWLMNSPFFTSVEKKRPWVILKWAESSNKIMALYGKQKWISNKLSQQIAHKFRAESKVVLVGSETIRIDNPLLTVRHWEGTNPIRAIIDRNLKLKEDFHIFDHNQRTWVYNFKRNESKSTINWIKLSEKKPLLDQMLSDMNLKQISTLLVEGGPRLLSHFIDKNYFDEIRIFRSNDRIEKGIKSPEFNAKEYDRKKIGSDTLYCFFNENVS
ncbi:MAG: riboflavin biosynthesis protein RibD [Bacteroidetes bacterium RIFCSPLOWO2_02_FULL_36_8]|nr:MAG: riboflavin biosynthesis protein RibD [Bacteroidetes bacterium RIFCSPLOWO2_02_FULL_36_8]OFY70671.1 MAG: riboflavin biosynthesis protein RibD [Bacteroidetes bacterium RIFCSPLOWO2_12_FULL_37_12]